MDGEKSNFMVLVAVVVLVLVAVVLVCVYLSHVDPLETRIAVLEVQIY